jgi:hypothetical protein
VYAHAHLDLHAVRPVVVRKGALSCRGRGHCVPRSREPHEEGLGLTVNDDTAVLGERLLQETAVFCHHVVVLLAKAMLELGRPLDVGEKEADGPAGQLAHAGIVTPPTPNAKTERRSSGP